MTFTGTEGVTVADWVYDTLTSDPAVQALLGGPAGAAARVHDGIAPEGTPYPFVSFTVVEPRDVAGVGMAHIWTVVPVQVKVIGQGASYAPLVPLYQAVHQALEARTNQQTPLGTILTCQRVSGIQYPEQDKGIEYRHLGGIYRTETQ